MRLMPANPIATSSAQPKWSDGIAANWLATDSVVSVAVDARAIHVQRVDETVAAEHAWRREWIGDVDRERGGGDPDEPDANPRVGARVAEMGPQQERDRGREVDHHVVVVQQVDDEPAVEDQPLHGCLAEHVELPLDVDDA